MQHSTHYDPVGTQYKTNYMRHNASTRAGARRSYQSLDLEDPRAQVSPKSNYSSSQTLRPPKYGRPP